MFSIGLDVGHSAVKMAIGDGVGAVETVTFPSAVCRAIPISDEAEAARALRDTVLVDGRTFLIGETALIQGGESVVSGLTENWIDTPEYAALLIGAYRKAMSIIGDRPHYLIMGLPTALYSRQKARLLEVAQNHIRGAANIKVVPQPMGPYFERLFNLSGLPSSTVSSESWAVVEIGYYTTDIMLMMSGRWVEKASGGCSGAHVAAARLRKQLSDRGVTADLFECDEALRSRSIRYFSQGLDVSAEVGEAVGALSNEIVDTAARLIEPYARKLNGVIVAGGGAEFMFPELSRRWPHAVKPLSPRFSVAEGMRRYGLMLNLSNNVLGEAA